MEEKTKPRRRWYRFSLRTMLVLVTLVGAVCAYLTHQPTLGRLEVGDFVVKIYGNRLYEILQQVRCVVTRNGEVYIPSYGIGYRDEGDGDVEFSLLESKNGVVGVIEKSKPNLVVVLFDTVSGEGWPYARDTETYEIVAKRGHRLLERLAVDYPHTLLLLKDDAAYTENQKIR